MIGDVNQMKEIDEEKILEIEDEKKPRGRPKTITLTKEEYHRVYYQQRYSLNKDEIKANCARNSKKYRDSYKLLLEIYQRGEVDREMLERISKVIE